MQVNELLLICGVEGRAYTILAEPPARLLRNPACKATVSPFGSRWPAGAAVLHSVLDPEECSNLIAALESTDDFAPRQEAQNVRRSDVIVWAAPADFMAALVKRFEPLLPQLRSDGFAPHASPLPVGLNSRLRCYRYRRGQLFKPHHDGQQLGLEQRSDTLTQDERLRSWFTCLIYLSTEGRDFEGGATALYHEGDEDEHPAEPALRVSPSQGSALVFPHGEHPDSVLHAGEKVTAGTKYAIRTEFLYYHPPSAGAPAAAA